MANFSRAILPALCFLSVFALPAAPKPKPAPLPDGVPVPQTRPAQETDEPGADAAKRSEARSDLPREMPVPEQRPVQPAEDVPTVKDEAMTTDEEKSGPPRSVGRHNAKNFTPRLDENAQRAEEACRERLKQLGVAFEKEPPLSDPQGCSVPAPLSISKLSAAISLEPPGVMNCAMAEAAARFAQTTISPAAKQIYGTGLKAVANASAYVCRPRNGTAKLSEHAFGNALDMSRFVLADGRAVEVAATSEQKAKDFLDRIRKAACGPFKTVLGPGSDADHATHFHVDMAMRRNGGTFCQ
jgi:hypothetical protein